MITPNILKELSLARMGYKYIAGIDEVGKGSWAGPIVAAAVIIPVEKTIKNVRDSKLLTPKSRTEIYLKICEQAVCWGLGIVDNETIDKIGIQKANILAMKRALEKIYLPVDYVLTDAVKLPEISIPQENPIKGDMRIYSIAAASILAKVCRDNMMILLSKKYPQYNFDSHKGYGTKLHQEALEKHGVSRVHRKSYKPIKKILKR